MNPKLLKNKLFILYYCLFSLTHCIGQTSNKDSVELEKRVNTGYSFGVNTAFNGSGLNGLRSCGLSMEYGAYRLLIFLDLNYPLYKNKIYYTHQNSLDFDKFTNYTYTGIYYSCGLGYILRRLKIQNDRYNIIIGGSYNISQVDPVKIKDVLEIANGQYIQIKQLGSSSTISGFLRIDRVFWIGKNQLFLQFIYNKAFSFKEDHPIYQKDLFYSKLDHIITLRVMFKATERVFYNPSKLQYLSR